MIGRIVRTRLVRSHAAARVAIECVVEEQRRNPDLMMVKFIKDIVRVERPVVIAHTRVVAAYNEMGAAVILPGNRVEDGLPSLGPA
ncbi:MAG: hypothetical protein HW390_3559 [Candidatus Brocadiaceae bacterium]|nr:hypothetical protein [Candidatus Brocadiaceae bacterium]